MQKLQYEDTYPETSLFSVGDENTELEIKAVLSKAKMNPFSDVSQDYEEHLINDFLARKNPRIAPKGFFILDAKSIPPQMLVFIELEGEDIANEDMAERLYCCVPNDDVAIIDIVAWQKGSRLIAHGRWRILVFPNNQIIKIIPFDHDACKLPQDWSESNITIEYRAHTPAEGEDIVSDDDPGWGDDDDD